MAYADAIQALADPTRRSVFETLRRGPRSVGDLARGLPVSRPAVSQHLRVLERAGLVTARRDGTRNFYSVNGDGLAELRLLRRVLGRGVVASRRRRKPEGDRMIGQMTVSGVRQVGVRALPRSTLPVYTERMNAGTRSKPLSLRRPRGDGRLGGSPGRQGLRAVVGRPGGRLGHDRRLGPAAGACDDVAPGP